MSFGHRGGEPIGRPVRFLAGVGRLARDPVSLRDRSHELEAIGELPDALGAEEPVDLRPGPEVRLDGPLREPRLGCFRLALGGLALRPRSSLRSISESAYFASLYCSATDSNWC